MKRFVKIFIFLFSVSVFSMNVFAQNSIETKQENLDTELYEELLTRLYEVEEGYAYCDIAVSITSSNTIDEDVTISIPDAVGTNVWRVNTLLSEADANCVAVELNNTYYYLSSVVDAVFDDEGVSFQTDKLGIFIAGGCFSEEDIENFSAGTSNFSIDESNLTQDGKWLGASYSLLDEDGDDVKETVYVFGTITDTTRIYGPNYSVSNPNYQTYGFYKVLSDHPDVTKAIINCSLGERTHISNLFVGCAKLTSLEFGTNFDTSNVTSMEYMFSRCSSLNTLDVSNFNTSKVTYMSCMFDGCKLLTTLDLSNFNTSSVTSMISMFDNCSTLISLDISNFNMSSVTNYSSMFYGCKALETLKTPSINSIKDIALPKTMYTWPDKTSYTVIPTTSGTSVTLHDSADCSYILNTAGDLFGTLDENGILNITGTGTVLDKKLSDVLGEDCTMLYGLNFDTNTIVEICADWCNNQKEFVSGNTIKYFDNLAGTLVLPNNLKTIGDKAFYDCSGFTGDLTIPNTVTTLGYGAFYNCTGFTGTLTLSNQLQSIGDSAFCFCNFTGDLVLPDGLNSVGRQAFYYCFGFDGTLTLGSGLKEIGASAFCFCNFTGDLILPDGLNSVGHKAFYYCDGFDGNLTISDSVTTIDDYAFAYCSNLRGQLIIPSGLTTISPGVFMDCYGFNGQLVIPDKITSIGDYAFNNCYNIRDIKIGTYKKILDLYEDNSKLTSIGTDAFYSDYKILTSLDTKNSTAEGYDWAGGNRFLSGSTCTIYLNTAQDLTGTLNLNTGELVISGTGTNLDIPLVECIEMLPLSNFTWQTNTIESICDDWCSNEDYFYYQTEERNIYPNLSGSLNLPNSIKSIGKNAFLGRKGFTGKLSLPNSLESIGNAAFMGCEGLTGDLIIPNTVTTLGYGAFYNCTGFTGTLTLSNQLQSIGDFAFCLCNFTGDLVLPNNLKTIGVGAFGNCSGFTGKIVIPDSVTTISDQAFIGCNNVAFIEIGNGVESIGVKAFACANFDPESEEGFVLVETPVPTRLKTRNEVALSYDWSSDMREVTYVIQKYTLNTAADLFGYLDTETGELSIEGTGTKLDKPLSDVLTTAEERALLKGLVFTTDTITEIGYHWCDNTDNTFPNLVGALNLPNNLKAIRTYAFYQCDGFTSLFLPDTLTRIEYEAFSYCKGFTGNLIIPDSVTSIGSSAFCGCKGFTGNLVIPDGITEIESWAFSSCSGLDGTLTLPSTLVYIRDGAFADCYKLTGNLEIPETVTTIEKHAFRSCAFTGDLIIPDSVTTLGLIENSNMALTGPFCCCEGFDGVLVLPNNLTEIGDYCFYKCTGFTGELNIPETVTAIGKDAFDNTNFTDTLDLPNSLESIGDYAFADCVNLSGELIIPSSVTSIGKGVFCDCSGFTGTLSIPNTVTSLGAQAFMRCSGFTGELVIPSSITSIDKHTFAECEGLTSIIIPDEVTNIEASAFTACSNVNKIYISSGVTSIGENAFWVNSTGLVTKLYTKNQTVLGYDWAGDKRTIVPMNTFQVTLPEEIILKPTYLNNQAAPIWYASFNIEVSGDFEDGSYGTFSKVPTFNITTASGEQITITTDVQDTTVTEDGTLVIPVTFTSPNPTLLKEYSGTFELNTVLHEIVPFAA